MLRLLAAVAGAEMGEAEQAVLDHSLAAFSSRHPASK